MNKNILVSGSLLRNTYRINKHLASGGFGNTYVATNLDFDEIVAIKEFFMKDSMERDETTSEVSVSNADMATTVEEQREKFRKEARRLRKLHNDHIVRVHDLFDENGTSYYVMDYVDGENLSERMKRTGKPLTEQEVWDLLPQILDALKSVHDAGLWHLDLKPSNIMVDSRRQVKLIDFGASKQLDAQTGGAAATSNIARTDHYAPIEQLDGNYNKLGPWSDIYSLGATLFNLLTQETPPTPSQIIDDETSDKSTALPMPNGVSKKMRDLIVWMMNANRTNRPQSVNEIGEYIKHNNAYSPVHNASHPQTDDKVTINNLEETIIGIKAKEKDTIEETFIGTTDATNKADNLNADEDKQKREKEIDVFGTNLNSTLMNRCLCVVSVITAICALLRVVYYVIELMYEWGGTWTVLSDILYSYSMFYTQMFAFIGYQVGIAKLFTLFGLYLNKLEIREAKLLFFVSVLEIIIMIAESCGGGVSFVFVWFAIYLFLVVCGGNLLIKNAGIPILYGISLIGMGLFDAIGNFQVILYYMYEGKIIMPYIIRLICWILSAISSLLFVWAMYKKRESIMFVNNID